jgi:cobyrinic acid a,c-diamide synthase
LLPGTVTLQQRLAALGPQSLGLPGGDLRGHTFHFSSCETPMVAKLRGRKPDDTGADGSGEPFYRHGAIAASYFHGYFPSCPSAVAALFGAAQEG